MEVAHPEDPLIRGVPHVMFTAPPTNPLATKKNAVLCGSPGIDRSPCGAGTSAWMAQLHARGELGLNRPFVHESVVGSLSYGNLIAEARVGE